MCVCVCVCVCLCVCVCVCSCVEGVHIRFRNVQNASYFDKHTGYMRVASCDFNLARCVYMTIHVA